MDYDLMVIGGGPGGYTAAIRASQRGLKTALVEKGELGGACLHRGCIPSKATIAAAEVIATVAKAEKMGISYGPPRIDYAQLVARKSETVKRLSQGLGELVRANRVDLLRGEGSLEDPTHLRVDQKVYETRFVILAGGTSPVRPPGFPFDGKRVVTTDELFQITQLPKRLLIVGGGVVGCEMASAYNLLGADVTIAEMLPSLLAGEDKIVSRTLKTIFEKRGIKLLLGQKISSIDPSYDLVLVAIGRRPEAAKLRLTEQGIGLKDGFVLVNDSMETSVAGIYAIGDLVGKTMLAHGAMAEGICAAEAIVGNEVPVNYPSIPRVTYTLPEVAAVGSSEEKLKQEGIPYRVGRFPYAACGKALCHEEEEGFCQVTVDPQSGRILGAVIVGAHASDLIAELALVMKNRLSVEALIGTVHAHPSFSEIIHEAVEDTKGLAIHRFARTGEGKIPLSPWNPHLR